MLRKWVIDAEQREPISDTSSSSALPHEAASEVPAFLPVQLPTEAPAADIRIELQKGSMRLTLMWPAGRAGECGAWLRELLR